MATGTKQNMINEFRKSCALDIDTFCGLISGVTQAGLFNPWDRALYLSIRDKRPFLSRHNFVNPYQGFWQSVFTRSISGGLYFVLQAQVSNFVRPRLGHSSERLKNLTVGITAGCLNGMAINQLAAIKYHSWEKDGGRFLAAAQHMWRKGGIRPFFNGMCATASRDIVFGCVYETLRFEIRQCLDRAASSDPNTPPLKRSPHVYFVCNMISAALATVMSGPFNYARNIKYSTHPSSKAPSIPRVVSDLFREALATGSAEGALSHLQARLRVGWGTLRVAVGMAFGQHMFEWTKASLCKDCAHT